jgi:hypothetical protein
MPGRLVVAVPDPLGLELALIYWECHADLRVPL